MRTYGLTETMSHKIIKLIFLALTLVSYCKCNDVSPLNCSFTQWSVPGRTGKPYCRDCSDCPPGMELKPPCATTIPHGTSTGCKACVKGQTYSTELSSDSCKPCNICGENRHVFQDCETNRNRVCGECFKGYYQTIAGDCKPCLHCCNNIQDSDKNDKCVRDGEKHCTADTKCQPKQEEILPELYKNATLNNGSNAEKNEQSKADSKPTVILTVLLIPALLIMGVALYRLRHKKLHDFKIYSVAPHHDDTHGSVISVTVIPVQVEQGDAVPSPGGSCFTGSFHYPHYVNLPDWNEDTCDTSGSSSSNTASRDTVSSVVAASSASSSRSTTPPLGPNVWCSCDHDQDPLSIEEESREKEEKHKN